MKRFRYWLDSILEYFFCVLLVVMVLFSLWQVISRYLFNDPSIVSEEFLRFSLIWLSITAAAYVAGKSKHVSFELFMDVLSEEGKRRLNIIIQSIFITFASVIMIYGGSKAVGISLSQMSPILNIPMGYIYTVLPISGVLIVVYGALNIYDLYQQKEDVIDTHPADSIQQTGSEVIS